MIAGIVIAFLLGLMLAIISSFGELYSTINWLVGVDWSVLVFKDWIIICLLVFLSILIQIFVIKLYTERAYFLFFITPFLWTLVNIYYFFISLSNFAFGTVIPVFWRTIGDLGAWLITFLFYPIIFGGSFIIGIVDGRMDQKRIFCDQIYAEAEALGIYTLQVDFVQAARYALKIYNHPFMHEVWINQRQTRHFTDVKARTPGDLIYWIVRAGHVVGCLPFFELPVSRHHTGQLPPKAGTMVKIVYGGHSRSDVKLEGDASE